MHALGPHQTFGLGALVGQHGSEAPTRTSVWIDGRGVFATVRLSFELAPGNDQDTRIFLLETPRDAVLCRAIFGGQKLDPSELPSVQTPLASSQFQAIEEILKEGKSELTVLAIPSGTEVASLSLEFLLSLDLLWHRGGLSFESKLGSREVDFGGRWDLTGLTGASICFSRGASNCRVETLEGSRYRWSEPLSVKTHESADLEFSLDEKKAASVAVFSPTTDESVGCAAVAVIAPVRAQLARDPVRLAIMVEARNPQESLLIRQMVESLSGVLRPGDELSLWMLGTNSPGRLISWTSQASAADEILSKLLEPTVIGRAEDLWSNLAMLGEQAKGATHVVLATNGAEGLPQVGTLGKLPVFIFATGRAPYRVSLESLAQRSGGAVVSGTVDNLEVFAERLKVRLSPPLLSEFKLDGWALGQLLPSGPTQVYSDQPTLVLGTHEGLLPKTVTLSGLSPSRQKLAQRVRVETLTDLDLSPLYKERRARWEGDGEPIQFWSAGAVTVSRVIHLSTLSPFFSERREFIEASTASTISLDLFASPAFTISVGDSLSGLPGTDASISDELQGAPPEFSLEPDLFQAEPLFSGPAGGPIVIFKDRFEQDEPEPDLFEDPAELNGVVPDSVEEERSFSFPTGPPIIVRQDRFEDSSEDESSAEGDQSALEFSENDGAKHRLGNRQEHDDVASVPLSADFVEPPNLRGASEGWTSEWLEKFQGLEDGLARSWIETCSIDHLGLATSLLEPAVAESVLCRLSPVRRRAVQCQMEWGLYLDSYEREQADRQLALALTQALI